MRSNRQPCHCPVSSRAFHHSIKHYIISIYDDDLVPEKKRKNYQPPEKKIKFNIRA